MTSSTLYLLSYMLAMCVGCYLPECQCEEGMAGLTISCAKLHSTQYLSFLAAETALAVHRVDITNSVLDCIDLQDLARLHNLKYLRVENSGLGQVLCPHRSDIRALASLHSLDVSHNLLTHLDRRLQASTQLEQLNLSHNQFHQLSPVLSSFTRLSSLDISHNMLVTLDQEILGTIQHRLQYLHLTGECVRVQCACVHVCMYASMHV